MVHRNAWLILFVALLTAGLTGCGAPLPPVDDAQLDSISLTPTNPSFARNTTIQFAATGVYSDKSSKDLTYTVVWNSSDNAVATVDGSGRVTGRGTGKATIKASSGSISGETEVTVTGATLVSISITPVNPAIAKGTTQQFTATGTFSDDTTQDLTAQATWSSSDAGVATVSSADGSQGLATPVAAGSTTITATSGGISGTVTLTVTPATLTSLAITPADPSIAKGTTQQFSATGAYSDNTTQDLTASVTWSSSNTGAATISNAAGSKGLATSVAAGTTTITATLEGVSQSAPLTVTPAILLSLTVTPASPSIASGATQQFTATGTYSDSTTQNLSASVTWSSSNTGAASISNATGSKGLATGIAAGSATITAVSGSVSATATLTITAASTGQVTLTWSAPSTYTDGTYLDPFSALAKYRIYYGSASHMYTQTVEVANPGMITLTHRLDLAPGTYYFTVTAVDVAGQESDYAAEVSKTL